MEGSHHNMAGTHESTRVGQDAEGARGKCGFTVLYKGRDDGGR